MIGVLRELGSIIWSSLSNGVEGHKPIEMHPRLPRLLVIVERIKLVIGSQVIHAIFKRSSLHTPDTDLLGFLDFLIENLKELRICNFDLVKNWEDVLQTIQEELFLHRSFLQNIRDNGIRDQLEDISALIRNAVYYAEYIVKAFAAEAFHVSCHSLIISDLTEKFSLIKEKVNDKEIIAKGTDASCHALVPTTNLNRDGIRTSPRASSPSTDIFVGLEAEKMRLMKCLASNEEQLDVISIVGMGGIGKTTLAKKVYEDPYSISHFHLRAWCCVSQEYDVKSIMLSILGIDDVTDQENSCEDFCVMLHKKLKWCRYLIVLDDVWNIDVFDKLKRYFPNDANGSRIMLTSRTISIGLHAKHHSDTIELYPLSNDESWNILEQKVFPREKCPIELFEIGYEIARKCRGLPLAVVVIAGILSKSDKDPDVWEEVAKGLNIYTAEDTEGDTGMKALDLSYELLPDHLKPLFLYVGAFPEDHEIPIKKLKWMWIAEGFIRQETEKNKSLEDQAEAHLMDLIDRSLLMVGKINSSGSVKTCHIHDLMREMSLRKAVDENFVQLHYVGEKEHFQEQHLVYPRRVSVSFMNSKDKSTLTSSSAYEAPSHPPITYEDLARLSMSSRLSSLLLFSRVSIYEFKEFSKSFFQIHKILTVFHMDNIYAKYFFIGETLPVHLRYISVGTWNDDIPLSLFSPWNLETLIITSPSKRNSEELPGEVWKMKKLRHLHIESAIFCEPDEDSCKLENLQTLSRPLFNGEKSKMIGRFPNLLDLVCIFSDCKTNLFEWPSLESLHQLESVTVYWKGFLRSWAPLSLPSTLKKLSLLNFQFRWKDISSFQELPNLEILKLKWYAVEDELWDMRNLQFPKLKFLKLGHLDIKQWIASDENFPRLQNLVLRYCKHLEEIPSALGDICSLKKIEVIGCSHSASESAKRIQLEQLDYGNEELKIYITDPLPEEQGD